MPRRTRIRRFLQAESSDSDPLEHKYDSPPLVFDEDSPIIAHVVENTTTRTELQRPLTNSFSNVIPPTDVIHEPIQATVLNSDVHGDIPLPPTVVALKDVHGDIPLPATVVALKDVHGDIPLPATVVAMTPLLQASNTNSEAPLPATVLSLCPQLNHTNLPLPSQNSNSGNIPVEIPSQSDNIPIAAIVVETTSRGISESDTTVAAESYSSRQRLTPRARKVKQRNLQSEEVKQQTRYMDKIRKRTARENESESETAQRQKRDKLKKRNVRASESESETAQRQKRDKRNKRNIRESESEIETSSRRYNDAFSSRIRRVNEPISKAESRREKERAQRFQRSEAIGMKKKSLLMFNTFINSFKMHHCTVCLETFPRRGKKRCCNATTSVLTSENHMYPFLDPTSGEPGSRHPLRDTMGRLIQNPIFDDITQEEEMLVARVFPIMKVRFVSGNLRYYGHTINFPQDIRSIAQELPLYPQNLPIVIVRKTYSDESQETAFKDIRVRRAKVLQILEFLIRHHPLYHDVRINYDALQQLPEDGPLTGLRNVELDEIHTDDDQLADPDAGPMNEVEDHFETDTFLPVPLDAILSDELIAQKLGSIVSWPEVEMRPLNEYETEGLPSLAFPSLFPFGAGDPTFLRHRIKEVSPTAAWRHLLKVRVWSPSRQRFIYPFALHPRFAHWAQNMSERKRILSQANFFLKRTPAVAKLSLSELRDIAASPAARKQLINKMSVYSANVSGSDPYWYQRRNELEDTFNESPASIYFTLSFADYHWPELHKLLGTENAPIRDRIRAAKENPHICTWFFTRRVEEFTKRWLEDVMECDWKWWRTEFQTRELPHIHGCAKLKNDPGLIDLAAQVYAGLKQSNDPECRKRGIRAETTILDYVDSLCTACHPDPSFSYSEDQPILTRPSPPDPHPCSHPYEDSLDDYEKVFSAVERHHCYSTYCLNNAEKKCRFSFPFPLRPKTRIHFEEHDNGSVRVTIQMKRNDARANVHNVDQLHFWRANCDLQFILDEERAIKYMVKYTTKPEKRTRNINDFFERLRQTGNSDSHALTELRSMMLKTIGERDIGKVETIHLLLGETLCHSDFDYPKVNLKYVQRLRTENVETVISVNNLHDHYSDRPEEQNNWNFDQFSKKYFCNKKGDLKEYSDNKRRIFRFYPKYQLDPNSDYYWQSIVLVMTRYCPWRGSVYSLVDIDESASDEIKQNVWIDRYQRFVSETGFDIKTVERFTSDIDRLRRIREELKNEDEELDAELDYDEDQLEDWMHLAANIPISDDLLAPLDQIHNVNPPNFDWNADLREAEQNGFRIEILKNWKTEEIVDDEIMDESEERMLSPDQLLAYEHVEKMMDEHSNISPYLFLIGGPGSGKSFLIKLVKKKYGGKCKVLATTGCAACNIDGSTCHSSCRIPVSRLSKSLDAPSAKVLRDIQTNFKDVEIIIVDEFSMIGKRFLCSLDTRLRQATGKFSEPFGGLKVIFSGDLQQLPPVCDQRLYVAPDDSSSEKQKAAFDLYRSILHVALLSRIHRQSDERLKSIALHCAEGKLTFEDWKMLQTRTPTRASDSADEKWENAVRLFFSKQEVSNYNLRKINALDEVKASIMAVNNCKKAEKGNLEQSQGLQNRLVICKGARVMITNNVSVPHGVHNGARGYVHSIFYAKDESAPSLPLAVIVKLDKYKGTSCVPGVENCVPIVPRSATWLGGNGDVCERRQIPLALCWAMTIHKAQGQTLELVVLDLGKTERCLGLSLVGLTRVKRLEDMLISPMAFSRLEKINKKKELQLLKEELLRLKNMQSMFVF